MAVGRGSAHFRGQYPSSGIYPARVSPPRDPGVDLFRSLLMKVHGMGQRWEILKQITSTPIGIRPDGRSLVSVRPGAGADRVGLQAGDVISQIQGWDARVCHASNVVRALRIIGEILALPFDSASAEALVAQRNLRNAATTGP